MLITVGLLVLISAFVAANLRDAPTASAYHETWYDLCDRTPAITALILTELRAWGAAETPPDTRYDAASGFGCTADATPEQSAQITETDLMAHTDWVGQSDRLVLGSAVTSFKGTDFAGLNINWIEFSGARITEVPARAFDGLTLQELSFEGATQLERLHPDAFKGLVVHNDRFVFRIRGVSKLTHEKDSIPPTVFDPLGDQGFVIDAANVNALDLGGPLLTQINTRWFASMVKITDSWGRLHLAPYVSNRDGRGVIDTYYYDDGDGRYEDGTKATAGENNVTSTTTKVTLGQAITAEILRYANHSDRPGNRTFTAGNTVGSTVVRQLGVAGADNVGPLRVHRDFWGSVDICARTPVIRDAILDELRAEQSAIYGTKTVNSQTGAVSYTNGTYDFDGDSTADAFGCRTGANAYVTKANLTAHTNWNGWSNRLDLSNNGLTSIRFDDFRYLKLENIVFGGGNNIPELPDGAFHGLPLQALVMNGLGLTKLQSELFRGVNATNMTVLGLGWNFRLSDVNIAPDVFDPLTNLGHLDFDNGAIGRINTRWFKELENLGNGASWFRLNMGRQPVVAYYSNNTGGYYDTGATNKVAYDPTSATDQAALRAAIIAAIDTTGTLNLTPDAKFAEPDGLGIDPCERNPAVWKELMRQFQHIRDDLAEAAVDGPVWHVDRHDVGDIRHERYANTPSKSGAPAQSECHVLRAQWVNPTTGAPVPDQNAPGASAELAIKADNSLGQHARNFRLDGSDLSGLQPSDLANLHAVERLWMGNTRLENVNAQLFADMPKLTHLNLSNNKIKTADLSGSTNFLSPLNNLQQLRLNGNLLTRFNSSWLTSSARSSLADLSIANNPIATMDLSGLNLTHLDINNTSIIELDPAITAMTNLRTFWWFALHALPVDGFDSFVNGLPSGLTLSIPHDQFGNPGDVEDAELDQTTLAFSLAHNAKIAEINRAGGGNQVNYMQLADPCRPTIGSGTVADWATKFGDLCLTAGQKDAFISSIDNFNAAHHWILKNSDLSDAQMATLLGKLANQDNVYGIQFNGNPEAFGAGFNDSALSAFSEFDDLWLLRLRNHDLNYAQANTILRNLEGALASDAWTIQRGGETVDARPGLTILDLSYNENLFKKPDSTDPTMMVDVDADDADDGLHNFLRGVLTSNVGATFRLNLQGTDLNFDQLEAVIWGIEGGVSEYPAPRTELWTLRHLNLADNPNLWKTPNQSGGYDDVTPAEITALLKRLAGVEDIYIGNTGITSRSIAGAVLDGLNAEPNEDKRVDPRDTTTLERLEEFSLTGNDLSAITGPELTEEFHKFATRNALKSPQLSELGLGGTGINLAQLTGIVEGLGSADLLDGVWELDLSNNALLFEDCDATLEAQIRRFSNLRHLNVSSSELSFEEFKCAVNALTPANAVSIIARDNRDTGDDPDDASDDTDLFEGVSAEDVAELLAPFSETRTNFVNTGLTPTQATAIANKRIEMADSDEERREIERRTSAQNPSSFTFQTPLPAAGDIAVQSGRASLRVAFMHNPMYQGSFFTILRYEYRYRVASEDDWGNTGTEAWRTASVGDLSEPGAKSFDIFGLQTETVYQVQLRASSVARPNVITLSGGTIINLPEIKRIEPAITEVNMRAGDQVRLEVDVYGLANVLDNDLYDASDANKKLIFKWSDDPSSGSFAAPNDARRVTYTAPGLPGTYTVMVEAQPLGICSDHHKTNFGVSDADRKDCQATITVRVSRAQTSLPPPDPINPAGPIPSSLTDAEGVAYTVFTPVDGGTFTSDDITITAVAGAVPDRQLVGISASASVHQAPAPVTGARMTISGSLYDIAAIGADRQPVSVFTLDEPLTACLPLPTAFRANISDVIIVERRTDGAYGVLSSKLHQTAGELTVCGGVSLLPTTIGVAKLGIVPEPPVVPTPTGPEPPETGATAPSTSTATLALTLGALLLLLATAATLTTMTARSPRPRPHTVTPAQS